MAKPQRIQLSRRKGFDLQAASRALNGLPCKVVARPTRYGNPFVVARSPGGKPTTWDVLYRGELLCCYRRREDAIRLAIEKFCGLMLTDGVRKKAARDLQGYNVACWCRVGEPCHADILLEFANAR